MSELQKLIRLPLYAERFRDVLHDRTDQFVSSLLQIGATMPDVEPKSLMAAAMTAAALDLPINKNLGFAWIVPYAEGKSGRKLAQFQMGWKGYVQLALRTGQYAGMAAIRVNAEAVGPYDSLGRRTILWDKLDEDLPTVGYFFGFQLTNSPAVWSFYWPRKKVEAHAARYSQAFRKKQQGPWVTHFDEMALKTVIANELRRWGNLSVSLQRAVQEDSAVKSDIDSAPAFFESQEEPEQIADAGTGTDVAEPVQTYGKIAPVAPSLAEGAAQSTASASNPESSSSKFGERCISAGISFEKFKSWALREQYPIRDLDSIGSFAELPERLCSLWLKDIDFTLSKIAS